MLFVLQCNEIFLLLLISGLGKNIDKKKEKLQKSLILTWEVM